MYNFAARARGMVIMIWRVWWRECGREVVKRREAGGCRGEEWEGLRRGGWEVEREGW